MQVPALIELAKGARNNNLSALARELGVPDSLLHECLKGKRSCPLDVQAMLADIAGLNAAAQVHEAMLEKHRGTPRGERLQAALAKPLKEDLPRLRREMPQAGRATLGVLGTLAGFGASALALGAGNHGVSALMAAVSTMCVM